MALEIQTAQNVILNFRIAGLGPRILARIIDGFFVSMWAMSCLSVIGSVLNSETGIIILVIIALLPVLFYDLLFEHFNNGQSIGKKLMKIQVVNIDGTTPSFGTYLIRWLFRLVDFTLTMGALAVIMVAFTEKSQRLGDLLAGTTVISLKAEAESRILTVPNLEVEDQHKVTYPDVLDKLTDSDIETIRSILNDKRYYNDFEMQEHLASKIKSVTGYTSEFSNIDFLKKVLDDYNYLAFRA